MATGTEGAKLSASDGPVVQHRFRENRAGGVSRAQKQHVEGPLLGNRCPIHSDTVLDETEDRPLRWQADRELRSTFRTVLHGGATAVQLREVLDDGQAQADAA